MTEKGCLNLISAVRPPALTGTTIHLRGPDEKDALKRMKRKIMVITWSFCTL